MTEYTYVLCNLLLLFSPSHYVAPLARIILRIRTSHNIMDKIHYQYVQYGTGIAVYSMGL